MPKVGSKHFPYTAKGKADAKQASMSSSKRVVNISEKSSTSKKMEKMMTKKK